MRVDHPVLATWLVPAGLAASVAAPPDERARQGGGDPYRQQAGASLSYGDGGIVNVRSLVLAQQLRTPQTAAGGADADHDGRGDHGPPGDVQARPASRYLQRDMLKSMIDEMSAAPGYDRGGRYVDEYV
jgi:hypothetical protein